jgi:hypothetical protein
MNFERFFTVPIFRRAIQGIILHLVALEVSTMLKSGHISEPERFYATLLFIKERVIENGDTSANENSMVIEEQPKGINCFFNKKLCCCIFRPRSFMGFVRK